MSNVLPMSESARDPLGFRPDDEPGIDPIAQEVFAKQRNEEYEFDKSLVRIADSDDGKRLLKWLRDNTIEAPTWMPSLGEHAEKTGYAREGQNALVREIEERIERARHASVEDYHTILGAKES